MSRKITPAIGPFFVDPDCCATCGVPLDYAPKNFDWVSDDNRSPCCVSKQPEGKVEHQQVIDAMRHAEVDCIFYRGTDPDVLKALRSERMSSQIVTRGPNKPEF